VKTQKKWNQKNIESHTGEIAKKLEQKTSLKDRILIRKTLILKIFFAFVIGLALFFIFAFLIITQKDAPFLKVLYPLVILFALILELLDASTGMVRNLPHPPPPGYGFFSDRGCPCFPDFPGFRRAHRRMVSSKILQHHVFL
jgi:hypothetical protein